MIDVTGLPPAPGGTEAAPDGSTVTPLLRAAGGSVARFDFAPDSVSLAVVHAALDEIWVVLSGAGEIWRARSAASGSTPLTAGGVIALPAGTRFQVRTGETPLRILGVTLPPWSGPQDAAVVSGPWQPTLGQDSLA
ncbi:MAG: cupin domain-containing protein [Pseudomonadales bacterium]|nr:cupin domain-containing protein [Pseudomonadales bacterium]